MKRLLTPIILFIVFLPAVTPAVSAQTIYTHADSLWISRRLHEPVEASSTAELFLSVARQFLGKPYVAHTLDRNEYEKLVVDVQGVDCTTFIEYALALTFCLREGQTDFGNFLDYLRNIRYAGGEVSYTARNHYFTVWTENNIGKGFVEPVELPPPPLSAIRRLQTDYMSTHVSSYAMLDRHREWLPGIIRMEQSITGRQMQYINPSSTTIACCATSSVTATSSSSSPTRRDWTPLISASPCGKEVHSICSMPRKYTRKSS